MSPGLLTSPRAAVAAAAPDIALGLVYLGVWIAPLSAAPGVLSTLTLLMVLEFIIIHSAGFMSGILVGSGTRSAKATGVLGLACFYTLFVGGFSAAFHTVWPLVSFWALMLNRLLGVIFGQAPEGQEREFVTRSWGVSVLFYLLGAFVTILPPIPRLGMTAESLRAQHVAGSGVWVNEPYRLVAFGFLYFTAVGISELFGHRWLRVETPAPQAARARG